MRIDGWVTSGSRHRFRPMAPHRFDAVPPQDAGPRLDVDGRHRFQTMDGFGFAMTGGSASLIAGLPALARDALLQELFGTAGPAIGISCLRLTIGASDLSAGVYSYDDLPAGETDPSLARFDLFAGDPDVVPVLQAVLAINPSVKLIASPWSAPAWMKTNGLSKAGRLRPDCYHAYARYFVRYIDAMRRHGIRISAVTPQNEPQNFKNDPSMIMTADEQAEFIAYHLGPALRKAAPDTEILCWDHNCNAPEYPLAILNDPIARDYVAGVAWHLYQGVPETISLVQQAHPDKKMYFTEQWVSMRGQFDGDLRWHARNVLIGTLRNSCSLVLEWNLASDPQGGPHTKGGAPDCLGGVTIGETVVRNVGYYLMAHTAKLIRPGSTRIASTEPDTLPNVAFRTPDDRIVLLVLNDDAAPRRFTIGYLGQGATVELEAGAVATYVWDAAPAVA